MHTAHTDRLWVIGGAAGAALLLLLSWLLLISPQNDETDALRDQAAAADTRVDSLRHRLAELKRQNGDLPQYKEALERDRKALPTSAGTSEFLRELQSAGDSAGVAVNGVVVGAPTVAGTAKQVYALPVTVTAAGPSASLSRFVAQLQQTQPRAVLVSAANLAGDGQGGSLAHKATLTLSLQAFVDVSTR